MAELNDDFIGCIHRQLTDRHMLYTKEFTSDGCLAQDTFSGVLKVTVLFSTCCWTTRSTR